MTRRCGSRCDCVYNALRVTTTTHPIPRKMPLTHEYVSWPSILRQRQIALANANDPTDSIQADTDSYRPVQESTHRSRRNDPTRPSVTFFDRPRLVKRGEPLFQSKSLPPKEPLNPHTHRGQPPAPPNHATSQRRTSNTATETLPYKEIPASSMAQHGKPTRFR